MWNGHLRNVKYSSKHIMGGVEIIGQSGDVLNGGDPKGGGACPPGGDPHDGGSG
jgi:hypothetical protein